jgi:hypothetical protein
MLERNAQTERAASLGPLSVAAGLAYGRLMATPLGTCSLFTALLGAACGPGRTTPAASEALATVILHRLDADCETARATGPTTGQEAATGAGLADLQLFDGVAEGVGVDSELARVLDALWAPLPIDFAAASGADSAAPGPAVARARERWVENYRERLVQLKKILVPRLSRDPRDTSARGLLAVAVLAMLREQRLPVAVEVAELVNEQFLVPRLLLPHPRCACRDLASGACRSADERAACQLPLEVASRLQTEAMAVANKPLTEIFDQNPRSVWLELARRFSRRDDPFGCPGLEPGKRGEVAPGDAGLLLRLKTCRGDAAASRGTYVAVTVSHLWAGDERVAELQGGRLVADGMRFSEGLASPLAQRLELDLRQRLGSTAGKGKKGKRLPAAVNPVTLCARKDLPPWQRLLYSCDTAPPATWRSVRPGEHAPLVCVRPGADGKPGPQLPESTSRGPAVLAVSADAVPETVSTVFCALVDAGHAVRFVGMPLHGPISRPWAEPVPCALSYPCVPSNEVTPAECEALDEALTRLLHGADKGG